LGALLGVIAALAGSAAATDPPAAPLGYDVGGEKNRAGQEAGQAGQETRYVSTGVPLQQMALEYVNGRATRDSTLDRFEAELF
jgi:hypothetical protein